MSVKWYIIVMLAATVMSWVAWLLVIFLISPKDAGTLGFSLFYASLFLALLGSFSLFGLLARHMRRKKKFIVEKVLISFRQGMWLAVIVVGALLLQSRDLLTWWNGLLLLLIVTVLEFFFISASTNREHRKYI